MASRVRFWFSLPDVIRSAALVAVAVAVGLIAWSGEPRLLPLAMLLPALWAVAPTRLSAALIAAGYFLAGSRGLPKGVSTFYGAGFEAGVALWMVASLLFVLAHAMLWTMRPGRERVIRYAIIAVLLSIPPVGIVGWAHPITAAGILFPEWGWVGLGAAAIGLLVMTTRRRPIAVLAFGTLWLWSAADWAEPGPPQGWIGLNTKIGGSGIYAGYQQHHELISRIRDEARAGASVIVLPESAFGVWTPTVERLWTRALEHLEVTVYGGAIVVGEAGYDNVMLELSGRGVAAHYRARMPVPVSMWQPWLSLTGRPAGARADFFANPVVSVRRTRVATLICYEQLLVWPVLQSMLLSPDLIVAAGNGWWALDTNIVAVQIATSTAWSKLFGIPLVIAVNT